MKSVNKFMVVVFLLGGVLIGCQKEIKPKNAPEEIKSYVNSYFPNCEIIRIIKEKENGEINYDVDLDCNTNIEFEDPQFIVVDIDSRNELPEGVIPNSIEMYVLSNYPNQYTIGWEYELNRTMQDIQLNTGAVLRFDLDNNFIKIIEKS